jgi:hypothetical protein
MHRDLMRGVVAILAVAFACLALPAAAEDAAAERRIQEEVWALSLPLPMFAYVVRPVGDGHFPLVVMNHGISLKPDLPKSFQ